MNGKWLDDADHDETRRPGESFLQRVHRRKTEARTVAPGHVAAPMAAPASVRIGPGLIAFTRICSGPRSFAR